MYFKLDTRHAEYLFIKSVFTMFILGICFLAMPIAAIEHDLRESATALQKWENPDGNKPLLDDSSHEDDQSYNEDVLEGYAVMYHPRE
jgi:hypothetical protein